MDIRLRKLGKPLPISRNWMLFFVVSVILGILMIALGIVGIVYNSQLAEGIAGLFLIVGVMSILIVFLPDYKDSWYEQALAGIEAVRFDNEERILDLTSLRNLREINKSIQPYFRLGYHGILEYNKKYIAASFTTQHRASASGRNEVCINDLCLFRDIKGETVRFAFGSGYKCTIEICTDALNAFKDSFKKDQ